MKFKHNSYYWIESTSGKFIMSRARMVTHFDGVVVTEFCTIAYNKPMDREYIKNITKVEFRKETWLERLKDVFR